MDDKLGIPWYRLQGNERRDPPTREEGTYLEDRSTATQKIMEKWSKGPQKGLKPVEIEYNISRQTKLCLLMCPEWDPGFPHYGIAKLAGVTNTAGFETKCFDLNVEAYNAFWSVHGGENAWDIHYDPWDGPRDWHWIGEQYWNELHHYVKPILDRAVDQMVEFAPDFLGVSLYYCNEEPTNYIIKAIKERLPDIKIIVGGPSTHYSYFKPKDIYDYVVNGEGERPLLNILMQHEKKLEVEGEKANNGNTIILRQAENERVSLDSLPYPDYSNMPMDKYAFPNGALLAISRGCIAKCTFCEETHYYKYRQRTSVSTLDEVIHMYNTYGTNVFYFVDSLVNGNLNELRAFAEGVIASGIKIHWSGYARCDGRMNLEYMQVLRDSGCEALNYGTESGAQEVLDAMDKKVTIPEMEANFRDGKKVGISAMTNWIVGYPNETYRMLEDSMSFIWRQRNQGLLNIGQGTGFSVGVDTIVGQNFDKFNLKQWYYYDHWITKDDKMSIAHKLIRMKCFSIYTDFLITEGEIGKPTRHNLRHRHYSIQWNDENKQKEIDYPRKDFNYDIIKPEISNFADSLVNEVWPLLHIMWRTRGGYKLNLKFNYEWELEEWGARNAAPLYANYDFEISDDGEWSADFWWDYKQTHTDYEYQDHEYPDENGNMILDPHTVGPVFTVMNFFGDNSNAAIRARKLAWKGDPNFKGKDPWSAFDSDWFSKVKQDFATARYHDYSFKYDWQGKGKWND
jgi:hypothetical protein